MIICSHYMRGHVADVFGLAEDRVTVIPNGIDPDDLRPVDDLAALRARFAAPHERLVLLVGRLVYEKGFQLALDALPGVIEPLGDVRFLVAGSGTARGGAARRRRAGSGSRSHGTFVGLDRRRRAALALPDRRPVRGAVASTSRSGSSRSRRWPPAARASSPTPAACARSSRTTTSACASARRDPRSLARMVERVLTDDALRDRLVAEAAEHVLRFDWADVAPPDRRALRRRRPAPRSPDRRATPPRAAAAPGLHSGSRRSSSAGRAPLL